MKTKYYFKHSDSELCYSENYFQERMKEYGLNELEVFEAIPDKFDGIFWCKEHLFSGDGTKDYCGKQCDEYKPRNGKSGCCIHHSTKMYEHGNQVILTKN